MSLSETMTALMDAARSKSGLTDKLDIADLTGLMDNFVVANLFKDTNDKWFNVNDGWGSDIQRIPVKQNEIYTASVEVKNISNRVNLICKYLNSEGQVLSTDGNLYDDKGNAPVQIGNEAQAYQYTDDYSNKDGLRTVTIQVKPANCAFLMFRVASYNLGSFSYRKPMVVKGKRSFPWTPNNLAGSNDSQPNH